MTAGKDTPIQLGLDLPDVEQPHKAVSATDPSVPPDISPQEAERMKMRKALAFIRRKLRRTEALGI